MNGLPLWQFTSLTSEMWKRMKMRERFWHIYGSYMCS